MESAAVQSKQSHLTASTGMYYIFYPFSQYSSCSFFTDQLSAAGRVFNTVELLEMILLQIPLDGLLPAQRVCKTFQQTIRCSAKLKIALGNHFLGNQILNFGFEPSLRAAYKNGDLQIYESIESGVLRGTGLLTPLWPAPSSPSSLTVQTYLCQLAEWFSLNKVTFHFNLEYIFPFIDRYRSTHNVHELQFRYCPYEWDADPEEPDESWHSMYATQPATNLLVLEPTNDYDVWTSYRTIKDYYVIVENRSGVTIGDVLAAAKVGRYRVRWIHREVMPAYHFAKEMRNSTEADAEELPLSSPTHSSNHIASGQKQEIGEDDNRNTVTGEEENEGSDFEDSVTGSDLWSVFHFRLFVPKDKTRLVLSTKE